ncbi:type I-E CRISPR-associated protein Cas6/Cse3/CasE [Actinomyces sp. B33]|uniref:type I-E CRISPR-associated protein Cas6/Cse3/CasE n=1 Tax=Actinomyces sp. B33 TaxID=2942131 RepID=UPI002341A9FB|nr:type I-E CRISPR-associated protein Cas6/Cse3/CasE [Actinomyces sp. B33]MDC4232361.1 type I-E CRISPR-associated protein Cas6/Cse3/CasE [Actinomyces sp. B33]
MYLTRIYLNPYRRGCRYLVASPQRMHAAVLGSFPPGAFEGAGEGRVLWRLDRPGGRTASRADRGPALALYISSPAPPDPAGIVEQAGYEVDGGVAIKRTDDFLNSLRKGQRWGFRITVNPTFRQSDQRGRKGEEKILGHVTVAQQTKWLLDRAAPNGFAIPTAKEIGGDLPTMVADDGERRDGEALLVGLVDRRHERFIRRRDDGADQVTLNIATFEGVLSVVDPQALRRALVNGIGRAKGYGAGLLTLARP